MAEADAIEAAFEDQVQTLFKVLATNLGDAPVTHKTDGQCVAIFKTGLATARKAKTLALAAI